MTDITTEDLLEVARGVFSWAQLSERYGEKIVTRVGDFPNNNQSWEFNPLTSNDDAFKVLEAIIKLDGCPEFCVDADDTICLMVYDQEERGCLTFNNKDLRTAIVKAYLSLVRS